MPLALCLAVLAGLLPARAAPAPERLALLRRGVNITNWFRYPPSADPAAIGAYLSDAAIDGLRRAGFTFVRLPVEPELLEAAPSTWLPLLAREVGRLERHGLAVVVELHPTTWRLEDRPRDRARLIAAWRLLAPALASLDPGRTFLEVLNEPVFPGAAAQWDALQQQAHRVIRSTLPRNTVILTGSDWSSVSGLLSLEPVADQNVLYTVHFYEPAELTSLAAYRPGLDRSALARLPFPAAEPVSCARAAAGTDSATADLIRFYCAQHWTVQAISDRLAPAVQWAGTHHAALLLGEFGASAGLDATSRLAWIAAVRQAAEAARVGWALWGYDDVMGFDLPRPPGARPRLDPALLGALGLH